MAQATKLDPDHLVGTPDVGAVSRRQSVTLSVHGNHFEMKPTVARALAERLETKADLAEGSE